MPVRKVSGGWKVEGTSKVHKTKEAAQSQLKAIKVNKRERRRSKGDA